MAAARKYRFVTRPGSGVVEKVCGRSEVRCRACGTHAIWGQLSPRRWVMVDQADGKIHACKQAAAHKNNPPA